MEIKVGSVVQYKSYVRPNPLLTGTVIEILPDLDKRKRYKYVIKPDKPIKTKKGTVIRYHPNEDDDGKPIVNTVTGQTIEWLEDVFAVVQRTDEF